MAGDAPLYRMALTFRLRGAIDVGLMSQAYSLLVAERDALRSVIEQGRDGVARLVVEAQGPPLEVVELSETEARGNAADAWCQRRVTEPFDPARPLVEAALLSVEADEHVLYWAQHHVVADAQSSALAFQRLSEIYAELESGEAPAPVTDRSYANYLQYEGRFQETDSSKRAAAFWGVPTGATTAGLYGDRSSGAADPAAGAARSTRTERLTLPLGHARSRRVRELGELPSFRGVSPDLSGFHVFATATLALLQRIRESSPEVSLLTPIHNRTTRAFKETLGVFIEVLPLTVAADPAVTLRDLAERVQSGMRGVLAHGVPGSSAYPKGALASEVVLNYIAATFDTGFAGRPAEARWLHPGHGDPAHALRIQVHDFAATGEFTVDFDVHCDVFGGPERAAVQRHFLAVLDALLDNPDQSLQDIDLLGEAEAVARRAALDLTAAGVTSPSVIEAIEERFQICPEAPALRVDGREVTYRELDRVTARAALALAERGVVPGDLVALHVPRSVAFVSLAVAALRLGAGFVPLDTKLPAARIRQMLERVSPRITVTAGAEYAGAEYAGAGYAGAGYAGDISPEGIHGSPEGIHGDVAQAGELLEGPTKAFTTHAPNASDRAYVMFTSGSTGVPKGVEISHGALANYVHWAASQYSPDGPKTFAFFSPPSVDLSITSIFVPLVTGGSLEVYPESEDERDLTVLDVIDDNRCDVVKLTPAHLALLIQRGPIRAPRLRTLIVGGEDLRRPLARRVQDDLGPDVAIYNEYGPTEATVGCMIHRFDLEDTAGSSVPIGRPIPGAALRVVNDAGRPVPDGVPGELWVGGAGLAIGYAGDADASAFIEDPTGERFYRTGDLVRIDAGTGDLTFLGRRDDQVKIRGVRIELAEVQAALESAAGVAAAAVLAEPQAQHQALQQPGESQRSRAHLDVDTDPRWSGVRHCARCGLASNHPEARLDESPDGICAVCLEFESYREAAEGYFGTAEELRSRLDLGRAAAQAAGSKYDCLALLSGGKDSTYALYQLVELGYRPLVFSLDNGYIAEGAQANIRRVVEHLGLDLVFAGTGSTSSMAAIFADSLDRFSNVCQGCFKTIYTLATTLAQEHGIRTIVTGLSRGQIFETRLAPIFRAGVRDAGEVDQLVVDARKTYHRVDDAVARHLDVSAFKSDEIFETVEFVDFYRYWDVPLSEVLDFIGRRAAWKRPEDTGRSTNCLINDVGIAVHKHERGFHNYALPYSWDVRLGHKTREECLDELDDEIDAERVQRILREIGAEGSAAGSGEGWTSDLVLLGYYVADAGQPLEPGVLRAALAESLPASMIPQRFVALEKMPLSKAGKVDRKSLREAARLEAAKPAESSPGVSAQAPVNAEAEEALVEIWRGVLKLESIGVNDAFLDLGGDSILGLQVVARARDAGWKISPREIFTHPTIRALASVAQAIGGAAANEARGDRTSPLGETPLTPTQRFGLEHYGHDLRSFAMSIVLEARSSSSIDSNALRTALAAVAEHHDALRMSLQRGRSGEVQEILAVPDAAKPGLLELEAGSSVDRAKERLCEEFDLASGSMLCAALLGGSPTDGARPTPDRVLVMVHHLAMDGLSWEPLLADIETAYAAALEGVTAALPPRTDSWRAWARYLRDAATSLAKSDSRELWAQATADLVSSHGPQTEWGSVADEEKVTRSLGEAVSRRAAQYSGSEALIAALAVAAGPVSIDVETHGRMPLASTAHEAPDVARTIGWFTALHPLVMGEAKHGVVERLKELSQLAVGGPLTAGTDDRAAFGYLFPDRFGRAEVLFNDLGSLDARKNPETSHFRRASDIELIRPAAAQRSHRLHVFTTRTERETIELHAEFSPAHDSAESVAALLQRMESALSELPDPGPKAEAANASSLQSGTGLSEDDLQDLLEDYG